MLKKLKESGTKIALVLIGLISLIWFLIRVIPKPSRAAYPCQRAAFPFASGFVIWITGLFSGKYFLKKTNLAFLRSNYLLAITFLLAAVVSFSIITVPFSSLSAALKSNKEIFEPTDKPNAPIGVGKGIFPGRVVWYYDPDATNWNGVSGSSDASGNKGATSINAKGYWFSEGNIIQSEVDKMISQSLCELTHKNSDEKAWDAIFKYFNKTHQKGEINYQQGEKIAVKINLNTSEGDGTMSDANCSSPQMVLGLLRQLVNKAKVPAEFITFYDVTRKVPSAISNLCRKEFPQVNFVDPQGGDGILKAIADKNCQLIFSQELVLEPLANPAFPTYLPSCITEAQYLINLANLKAHSLAGVTLCAKNHLGSIIAPNSGDLQAAQASGIHPYLAVRNSDDCIMRPMKSYNVLVDLIGEKHLGGNTLLFLVDGLYAARSQGDVLDAGCKWKSAPFNGNWTSSFFASLDNVAIESVCLDFLRSEQAVSDDMINVTGTVDNYLHESALAGNPPSGTFYHPNGSTRLESLGVHEHWNNANDKKYSRNLGTGTGIELISIIDKRKSPSL
jgi:hypothetical protein